MVTLGQLALAVQAALVGSTVAAGETSAHAGEDHAASPVIDAVAHDGLGVLVVLGAVAVVASLVHRLPSGRTPRSTHHEDSQLAMQSDHD